MTRQRDTFVRMAPLVFTFLVIAGDRISKLFVQHHMSGFEMVPIIPGWLRIIHTENPGAAFGMLAEGNPVLRSVVLIGISALVLVFVASSLWGRSASFSAPAARFGLALVLGGAAGNLYDRVAHGTVTDFIEVFHGNWSFPAFNVADSAITVGAIFLLSDMLRSKRRSAEERKGRGCAPPNSGETRNTLGRRA